MTGIHPVAIVPRPAANRRTHFQEHRRKLPEWFYPEIPLRHRDLCPQRNALPINGHMTF